MKQIETAIFHFVVEILLGCYKNVLWSLAKFQKFPKTFWYYEILKTIKCLKISYNKTLIKIYKPCDRGESLVCPYMLE